MKLAANFLAAGKYWKAGEEIPDAIVPPRVAARWAIDKTASAPGSLEAASAPRTRRYVRRGAEFKPLGSVKAIPGERLFRLEPGSEPPKFVSCGRVSALRASRRKASDPSEG